MLDKNNFRLKSNIMMTIDLHFLKVSDMRPTLSDKSFTDDHFHSVLLWIVGLAALMTAVCPGGEAHANDQPDVSNWRQNALGWTDSPVDLRFLNEGDRPAGSHGFLQAVGDQLVFTDATPVRFWGCNVAGPALFVDNRVIEVHAQRIAALGYNLVRLHHHDSTSWVSPTVIDKQRAASRHLDEQGMAKLDYWIKCLRDQGVYVMLDLHTGRVFREGDEIPGFEEIKKKGRHAKGFCYVNSRVQTLMREFNEQFLTHVNPHTSLAYKDDPAVAMILLTNENDLTQHFGNHMLADKNVPHHHELFKAHWRRFAQTSGLPESKVRRTWEPGPSKLFLADLEHRFNRDMIAHLRALGVRAPIVTTSVFGKPSLYCLAPLTTGDVIDLHHYGRVGALSDNPHHRANYAPWMGLGQVMNKPYIISEWHVFKNGDGTAPAADRMNAPLYLSAIASLQGWDALMIYNYSQDANRSLARPGRVTRYSTFADPAVSALTPAAAIAFRQGHIQQAKQTYYLDQDDPHWLFNEKIDPSNASAIRTLIEQHRLVTAIPAVRELPWLKPSEPKATDHRVTDLMKNYLSADSQADAVHSDTDELYRNWRLGYHTIVSPRTVAAAGDLQGKTIVCGDVTFRIDNPQAVAAISSLDNQPIRESKRLLLTTVARVETFKKQPGRYWSEPVAGLIELNHRAARFSMMTLDGKGRMMKTKILNRNKDGRFPIELPAPEGSHWYLLTPMENRPLK